MIKIGTTSYIRPLKKFVIVLAKLDKWRDMTGKYHNQYLCYNRVCNV